MKMIGILLAAAAAATLMAQTAAPKAASGKSVWVGTWKADIAASQYHEAPKSETVTITAGDEKRLAYHGTSTDTQGKNHTFRWSGAAGKDAPAYRDGKKWGNESWKLSEPNSWASEQESNDGTKVTGKCDMADDKSTVTCSWHSVPKTGDPYDEKVVWKKS